MYCLRSGLLYSKYGLYRCHELQCMCGGIRGKRDDRELGGLHGMYGGQLQDQRRQCGVYRMQCRLLVVVECTDGV